MRPFLIFCGIKHKGRWRNLSEKVETVKNFYQNYNEDKRMVKNKLEYIRCKEIISRSLKEKNMTILDNGGATGAFSFWLAEKGHKVSLIDFIPKHIEIAQEREKEKGVKLDTTIVGDARELPFNDNCFDLVLLMGPLYHLTKKSDRLKSLKEAYRVLKPGGKIIAEAISRFASMVDGFKSDLIKDPEYIPIMKKDIKTGLHKDTSTCQEYFTNAYFHRPEEVRLELVEAGFIFKDLIAVESFGCTIPEVDKKIQDKNYRNELLNTIKLVEKEPSLMGISNHYMGIGKKKV